MNEGELLRGRPLLPIRGMTNSANDERNNRSRPTLSRPVNSGNDKGNGGGVNTDVDDEVEVNGEEDDDDQTFAALVISTRSPSGNTATGT